MSRRSETAATQAETGCHNRCSARAGQLLENRRDELRLVPLSVDTTGRVLHTGTATLVSGVATFANDVGGAICERSFSLDGGLTLRDDQCRANMH